MKMLRKILNSHCCKKAHESCKVEDIKIKIKITPYVRVLCL